jgi:hypothetical protein
MRDFDVYYILEDKEVRKVRSLTKWGEWMAKADRHVAQTHVDHFFVSTVFLGLDHSWLAGPPLLFETMVFDGDGATQDWSGLECRRYSIWAEAETGHAEFVDCLTEAKDDSEEAARLLMEAHRLRVKNV